MKILAFETAADPGSVALWLDGEVLERFCPLNEPNSMSLLPLTQALMREADLDFSRLAGVAFGRGPGAFTGLRVACGVAQGIAIGRDLPLLGVGTLEAMAHAVDAERVLVALDARMGEVYYGYFEGGEQQGALGVALPRAVPQPMSLGWVGCGDGFLRYPELREHFLGHLTADYPDVRPAAKLIAEVAAPRFLRGERTDLVDAQPEYIRDKVAKTVHERLLEGGRA